MAPDLFYSLMDLSLVVALFLASLCSSLCFLEMCWNSYHCMVLVSYFCPLPLLGGEHYLLTFSVTIIHYVEEILQAQY